MRALRATSWRRVGNTLNSALAEPKCRRHNAYAFHLPLVRLKGTVRRRLADAVCSRRPLICMVFTSNPGA